MKHLYLIAFALIAGFAAQGQAQDDASQKIVEKVKEKYVAYGAMEIRFTQIFEDSDGTVIDETENICYVKGNKFRLEMLGQVILFDGVSMWVWYQEGDSGIASKVDVDEVGSFSPNDLFTLYEKDFKYGKSGTATKSGKTYDVISFFPNDRDLTYHTIKLYVSQTDATILQAVMIDRDQQKMTYKLNSIRTNQTYADSFFTFSKQQYPKVEIN